MFDIEEEDSFTENGFSHTRVTMVPERSQPAMMVPEQSQAVMRVAETKSKPFRLVSPPIRNEDDLINKVNQVRLLSWAFKEDGRPSDGGNQFFVLHGPSGSGKRVLAQYFCSGIPVTTDSDIRNTVKEGFYSSLDASLNTYQGLMEDDKAQNTKRSHNRKQKPRDFEQKWTPNPHGSSISTLKELLALAKVQTPVGKKQPGTSGQPKSSALICSEFPALDSRAHKNAIIQLFEDHMRSFKTDSSQSMFDFDTSKQLPVVFLLVNTDLYPHHFVKDLVRVTSASEIDCTPGVKEYRKVVKNILDTNLVAKKFPPPNEIQVLSDSDMNKTWTLLNHWARYKDLAKPIPHTDTKSQFGSFHSIGKVLYNKRRPAQMDSSEESVRYKGEEFHRNKDNFYFNLKELIVGLRSIPYGLNIFRNQFEGHWPQYTSSYEEMALISRCVAASEKRLSMRFKIHASNEIAGNPKEDETYLVALAFMTKAATPPPKNKMTPFTTRKRHPKPTKDDLSSQYDSRIKKILALHKEIYGNKSDTGSAAARNAELDEFRYAPGELPPGFGIFDDTIVDERHENQVNMMRMNNFSRQTNSRDYALMVERELDELPDTQPEARRRSSKSGPFRRKSTSVSFRGLGVEELQELDLMELDELSQLDSQMHHELTK